MDSNTLVARRPLRTGDSVMFLRQAVLASGRKKRKGSLALVLAAMPVPGGVLYSLRMRGSPDDMLPDREPNSALGLKSARVAAYGKPGFWLPIGSVIEILLPRAGAGARFNAGDLAVVNWHDHGRPETRQELRQWRYSATFNAVPLANVKAGWRLGNDRWVGGSIYLNPFRTGAAAWKPRPDKKLN